MCVCVCVYCQTLIIIDECLMFLIRHQMFQAASVTESKPQHLD